MLICKNWITFSMINQKNEAYKLAVNDAKTETKNNKAIKKLAEDNLKRLLKALIDPLIEENGNKYTYDWSVENEK